MGKERPGGKLIVRNKRASFDYELGEVMRRADEIEVEPFHASADERRSEA